MRIAAWAGNAGGNAVTGIDLTGPQVTLQNYGEIVEVSAIVGAGDRGGVDMVWGNEPIYGHFGLDLTGPNGGVVRIDDIEIEDVTGVFLRDMLGWVDRPRLRGPRATVRPMTRRPSSLPTMPRTAAGCWFQRAPTAWRNR